MSTYIRGCVMAVVAMAVFVPSVAYGAVVINEIAWMGTAVSANDEWIELHNTGNASVSLEGWTLTDNVSLTISLSGSIESGGYGVLERTDDASAPGEALVIYTGALANDGRTLTLKREDGSIEDQVAGGSNWSAIGGNNETKDTAQYTGSGWVTAPGTPGAQNASTGTPPEEEPPEEEEEDNDDEEENPPPEENDDDIETVISSRSSSGGSSARPRLFENDPLKLRVSHTKEAHVHQKVQFVAQPSGLPTGELHTLRYLWNFGDGTTSDARMPVHTYTHPGAYVVVVSAFRAGHEVMLRTEVTILPVAVSIARMQDGGVYVHNNTQFEADVSGLVLSDGYSTFTVPDMTYIVPNGTLALSSAQTGFGMHSWNITAHDRGGVLIAKYPESLTEVIAQSTLPSVSRAVRAEPLATAVSETPRGEILATSTEAVSQMAAVAEVDDSSPIPQNAALFGFVALLLISILALYSHKLV